MRIRRPQRLFIASRRLARRAFTLPQLLVAVAVLVIVIVATAKLFATAGKVTGTGQALADVIQEASSIEQQLRKDIERLSKEGFFAVRCVAVRNDFNGTALINPNLPPNAWVRADQLVFFANGVNSVQSYRLAAGSNRKGQATSGRIYWGHAFQLLQGKAFDTNNNVAHDLALTQPMFPWYNSLNDGTADTVLTLFDTGSGTDVFTFTNDTSIDATQPPASQWLLARHPVLFAHDNAPNVPLNDNSRAVFLGNNLSAKSFFHPELRNGRVDAASTGMDFIRDFIISRGTWPAQSQFIRDNLIYYPRAERVAPSMHRVDQALTNHVISSGCSSFRIEWTWQDGTGFLDNSMIGFSLGPENREQPWFGLPDPTVFESSNVIQPNPVSGASMLRDPQHRTNYDFGALPPIIANNIETVQSPRPGLVVYDALFGYNREFPLDVNGNATFDLGYTPWPSAIRVTMTLHDPEGKLENGREFQFVLNLPRNTR